jgi:hypothetical protein
LAIAFILHGCHHEYPPFFYETVSMALENADNSDVSPVLDTDSVPAKAYAIQLNLSMNLTSKDGADSNESGFSNEDRVVYFAITSPMNYNNIAPNQSLNDFFNFSTGNGTGAPITADNYTSIFSGNIGASGGAPTTWNTSNYLILMNPPASMGNYTFYVSALFSDGRSLADTISVNLYE